MEAFLIKYQGVNSIFFLHKQHNKNFYWLKQFVLTLNMMLPTYNGSLKSNKEKQWSHLQNQARKHTSKNFIETQGRSFGDFTTVTAL